MCGIYDSYNGIEQSWKISLIKEYSKFYAFGLCGKSPLSARKFFRAMKVASDSGEFSSEASLFCQVYCLFFLGRNELLGYVYNIDVIRRVLIHIIK